MISTLECKGSKHWIKKIDFDIHIRKNNFKNFFLLNQTYLKIKIIFFIIVNILLFK